MWNAIKTSAEEMSAYDHQFQINPKSGMKKWLRAIANPAKQDDGSIIWTWCNY
jgi:hypothetical protein